MIEDSVLRAAVYTALNADPPAYYLGLPSIVAARLIAAVTILAGADLGKVAIAVAEWRTERGR